MPFSRFWPRPFFSASALAAPHRCELLFTSKYLGRRIHNNAQLDEARLEIKKAVLLGALLTRKPILFGAPRGLVARVIRLYDDSDATPRVELAVVRNGVITRSDRALDALPYVRFLTPSDERQRLFPGLSTELRDIPANDTSDSAAPAITTERQLKVLHAELNRSVLQGAFAKGILVRHGFPKGVLSSVRSIYVAPSGSIRVLLAELRVDPTGASRIVERDYGLEDIGLLRFGSLTAIRLEEEPQIINRLLGNAKAGSYVLPIVRQVTPRGTQEFERKISRRQFKLEGFEVSAVKPGYTFKAGANAKGLKTYTVQEAEFLANGKFRVRATSENPALFIMGELDEQGFVRGMQVKYALRRGTTTYRIGPALD